MADYVALYCELLAAQAEAVAGLETVLENLILAHKQAEERYSNAVGLDTDAESQAVGEE